MRSGTFRVAQFLAQGLLPVCLSLLAACSSPSTPSNASGSTSTTTPPVPTVLGVTVIPEVVFAGDAAQAIAIGVTGPLTWQSSNPAIATITASGQVTAVAPGTTRLTASLSGTSASVDLTVHADSDVTGVTVDDCVGTMIVGQLGLCRATARIRNGAQVDLSVRGQWSSSNPAIVRSEGTGLFSTRSGGEASMTATFRGQSGARLLSIEWGTSDNLYLGAYAGGGSTRAGADISMTMLGNYGVVTGPVGSLTLELRDQSRTLGAASLANLARGGDRFQLTAYARVRAESTRVCPVLTLRVGANATVVAPDAACMTVVN